MLLYCFYQNFTFKLIDMALNQVFAKFSENPRNISEEAIRIIVKIADNILMQPENPKVRTLQKSNKTISSKVLATKGGLECLKIMGFQENNTCLTMAMNVSLEKIKEIKETVLMWKDSVADITKKDIKAVNKEVNKPSNSSNVNFERIKKTTLPPLVSIFTNPFLHNVETYFHNCLQYDDKDLQARARKLVPLVVLDENSQKRMRAVQEHIKKNKLEDPDITIQEFLILELLNWFKEEFFSWVDTPDCSNCGSKTVFSHLSTDTHDLVYTNRVEMHRCKSCRQFTPFPRYNDVNILLETRRGRCGEWANVFTLFCIAMGWDARFTVDSGDHVWTEVYSIAQKRWLHCDPCENICDTPLIYETGWKKNISYVISYSPEEVQDVTWRYSSNHKEVLRRRKSCTEQELLDCLEKLRETRQKKLSETRRKYLTKRMLFEVVELMQERKPTENDKQGRISGSESWRLTRGEIQENFDASFVWKIKSEYINNKKVTITYSAATDKYQCISDGTKHFEINKWSGGAFSASSIFRKEEKDWKQVYLSRQDPGRKQIHSKILAQIKNPGKLNGSKKYVFLQDLSKTNGDLTFLDGSDSGAIAWKIDLTYCDKILETIVLNFQYTTFETGQVKVTICSGDKCIPLAQNEKMLTTKNFEGSKSLTVTANLTGGKGENSWQHAQLFRQAMDCIDFPFSLTLIFK